MPPKFMNPAGSKRKRRWLMRTILLVLVAIVVFFARPGFHILKTAWQDRDERETLPPSEIDDASRMNRTKVSEVWLVPSDAAQAERQLAELLKRARRDGLKMSIAGARHSMGGHAFYPEGIVIDMSPFDAMTLDAERRILTVQSGATWAKVMPFLDAARLAVGVMQSNDSFSVGGSISVNCHGWAFDRPPICSTVESFRLMSADGAIVRCSRRENPELFSLVLGGYGLFGIILDVELRVVPNECYRLDQFVVPIADGLATFRRTTSGRQDVRMVYARMNIVPDRMFDEMILNVLTLEPGVEIPPLDSPEMPGLTRAIFRGSAGSDYGKELRWDTETRLQPRLSKKLFSRNQLMNVSAEILANRSATWTDILHEYFVPGTGVAEFIRQAREIILWRSGDLLNVTVRSVNEDTDTFLRYADQPMYAFVMLFHQERTDAADLRMQRMTRELIDAVLAAGGRYYLPYRLHATPEQFHAAYPQAREFFNKKRQYDPEELFQNQFYRTYGTSSDNRVDTRE